jgi:penicillin-binding protein 1B
MRVVIKKSGRPRSPYRALGWLCLGLFGCLLMGGASLFTYYYVRFSRVIDERLQGPVFPNVSQIYAAPEELRVGENASLPQVVSYLRSAGSTELGNNPKGSYTLLPDGVRIVPGPDAYFAEEAAEIRFSGSEVSSIISLKDQLPRSEYYLEPVLITNLFDRSREKRRLIPFRDLPPVLVNAIVAIEDRHFFQHSGVDYLRILKAAYVDIRSGRARQGASTITMQLARGFFLNPERTLRRKLEETLVAFLLEHRLSKQEIFEYYCNQIYLGQREGFSISGFGEASQVYFNKDVQSLTLPEAAFLAGIIRGPNLYSPYRNRDAAVKRRNQVLEAMGETGAITPQERDEAVASALRVTPSYEVANDAPYFVDMVKDQLLANYSEQELISGSYRVYTTLDLKLQRAASEAMRIGMAEVDQRLAAMRKSRRHPDPKEGPPERVEASIIVLDPHTGAVKALLGGRDYGRSQFNRILSRRQPGSAFKPFVYATALSTGLNGGPGPFLTAVSRVQDEPTTFMFNGNPYEPANYKKEYFGDVTLRYALAHSLNVATVKVAETVGYDAIVALARNAGMNLQIQPTPAVALGAYEVKPLEIAGAYTIFANQGVRMDTYLVSTVRSPGGAVLEQTGPKSTAVLDPRVAFLMTSLMEGVIEHGTGTGVRARGFMLPAAGKTGTSHDGWFAGYTSKLLCIVWVGYDSNKELPLSGAASALPIWTEFMKRASAFPEYGNVTAPVPPSGVARVEIDPASGALATPNCPRMQSEYFLEGTQPTQYCPLHYMQQLPSTPGLAHIASIAPVVVAGPASPSQHPQTIVIPAPASAAPPAAAEPEKEKPKKRGFFGRILGVFRGGSDKEDGTQQ